MLDDFISLGPNRYICTVLENMRETLNTIVIDDYHRLSYGPEYMANLKSHMLLMVEEAQYLATRMEDCLSDIRDIRRFSEERQKLKEEIKELRKTVKELKKDVPSE